MRARPADSPGAIRSPARTRESRASTYPGSVNAAVCGHACCRRWPSRLCPRRQRSRHRDWSDDFRLTDDLKAINRSAVSFSTAGYPGRRGSVLSPVEIGFLLPQAHHDRWPAGMLLRQVRRDHIRSGCRSRSRPRGSRRAHKIVKVDSLLDQTKCMQNRSIVVHYQRRFVAHLDKTCRRRGRRMIPFHCDPSRGWVRSSS